MTHAELRAPAQGHAAAEQRPLWPRISPMEMLTQFLLDEWDARWFGNPCLPGSPMLGTSGPWLHTTRKSQDLQPETACRPILSPCPSLNTHTSYTQADLHVPHRLVPGAHHTKSSSDGAIGQAGQASHTRPEQPPHAYAGSNGNGFHPSPVTESPTRTPSVIQTALQTTSLSLPCNLSTTLGASLNISNGDHSSAGSVMSPLQLPPGPHDLAVDAQPDVGPAEQPPLPAGELQPVILGTWVNRQYRLLEPIVEKLPGPPTSQQGSIANAVGFPNAALLPPNQSAAQGIGQGDGAGQHAEGQELQRQASESGSDAAADAAWRWRFVRRWHAEQQRSQAPDQPVAASLDKTEEALAYLQAGGGGGWNMQVAVARTQSTDGFGLQSGGTQGNGSLLAGDLLLEDSSYTTMGSLVRTMYKASGGANGEVSATCQVNSINRRALHLLEQQQQLERAAQARWDNLGSGDGNWVGHHLATVEIDDWGTFRFLVMRVNGRNDKQRILIRGRNYCSEGQISQDINRKVIQLAADRGAHYESLEVMGGGVMEWRRERDRHLHLHSGYTSLPGPSNNTRPTSGQEVLNLAAVLTKQHLPVHFKVSIEGAS